MAAGPQSEGGGAAAVVVEEAAAERLGADSPASLGTTGGAGAAASRRVVDVDADNEKVADDEGDAEDGSLTARWREFLLSAEMANGAIAFRDDVDGAHQWQVCGATGRLSGAVAASYVTKTILRATTNPEEFYRKGVKLGKGEGRSMTLSCKTNTEEPTRTRLVFMRGETGGLLIVCQHWAVLSCYQEPETALGIHLRAERAMEHLLQTRGRSSRVKAARNDRES